MPGACGLPHHSSPPGQSPTEECTGMKLLVHRVLLREDCSDAGVRGVHLHCELTSWVWMGKNRCRGEQTFKMGKSSLCLLGTHEGLQGGG